MGCIISYCKKNNNESDHSFLLTHKYCFNCNQTFTINNYNKHIVKCNRNYGPKK